MKRKLIGFVLCAALIAPLGAREMSSIWARLYRNAITLEQQIDIMTNMVDMDDPDLAPVLVDALIAQIEGWQNPRTFTENTFYMNLTRMIVKELGDLGAYEAAQWVFQIVENTDDPFLKGEALIALGRMDAEEYAEKISLMLRNLNFNLDVNSSTTSDRANEIIAYAAVICLERMKVEVGFSPVFFASIGWYSSQSGVRERASAALDKIMPDPTDFLIDLISSEDDFEIILTALSIEDTSSASNAGKLDTAVAALRKGIQKKTQDVKTGIVMSRVRQLAADMLRRYQYTDDSAVPLLKEMLNRDYDLTEKLYCVAALDVNHADPSVQVLADFLTYHNDRRESGINTLDERITTAVIAALGNSNNPLAIEPLTMVRYSNWSNSVIRESKKALEQID